MHYRYSRHTPHNYAVYLTCSALMYLQKWTRIISHVLFRLATSQRRVNRLHLPHHWRLAARHTAPPLDSSVPFPHLPPHRLLPLCRSVCTCPITVHRSDLAIGVSVPVLGSVHSVTRIDIAEMAAICWTSTLTNAVSDPSFWVLFEGSTAGKVVAFAVAFLPSCQSAHVPR